ncbi:EmrB/QacA subfamily drug resistance transporter [Herbihabitans rhizosphaerae]|uniref:EmrB/QacA subfamily drug resistance transporter n=1 Tax=Herbihabitans rhizosphaerae TaxID=1872711 RepID=A0A4Q7KW96_9PSEU|nr:DHA2 family efflux MFS transporter permease subunit [Herbihabitans rhizosphaerae]RZS41338.1 EmrB/QacA subfamily drug resistance transporter [Herbihabitans rhizosphaerae]
MTDTRRWWALGALSLAMLTLGLDITVLNVAMPTLAVDLSASTGELQWFSNAYTLVMAALLLPAGMLGDRFGRKRLLLGALAMFGLASAVCAWASDPETLIIGRTLLGLGAAFMMPLSMAVLPVIFPEPRERSRAITIWVTSTSIGMPLGPILGGWLLDEFWWGSVFLINLPLIAAGMLAVALFVPESRGQERRRVDVLGMITSGVGLLGVTYGLIDAGERGWTDARALLTIAGGMLVLVGFVLWQRRARSPLIDLSLFSSARFTWATVLSTMVNFAMFGLLFVMPQYFQAVGGSDALETGLRLLPMIAGIVVGAKVAGALVPRFGAKITIAVAFVLLAMALTGGATTGMTTPYGYVGAWMGVLGVGVGMAMPTAMDVATGELSTERAGAGSALIQSLRQVGGTIGVAILGTVLSSGYRARLDLDGVPAQAVDAVRDSVNSGAAVADALRSPALLDSVRGAFTHGMSAMMWTCAGLAVLGAVLAAVFLPSRVERSDVRQGESRDDLVAI